MSSDFKISEESYRVLEGFRNGTTLPEDEILYQSRARVLYLTQIGLLASVTVVPCGVETDRYQNGLIGYYITPKGLDALTEFENESEKQAREKSEKDRDIKRGWAQFFLGFLFGLITALVPYIITWVSGGFSP